MVLNGLQCVYLDPARRDKAGDKTHLWEACEPNLKEHIHTLLSKTEIVLVKASPMLDITLAQVQMPPVSNIYVVSFQNEVKEILFQYHNAPTSTEPHIHCVEITKNSTKQYTFTKSAEQESSANFGNLKKYLYEPYSGILKAGMFKTVSQRYGVDKLHTNTHLYTSASLVQDFPGRIFEVLTTSKADKKEVQKLIPTLKANVAVRNYPLNAQALGKKMGITDGGDFYLWGFTDIFDKKIVALAKKINY
jgi:hypothetical protein